jgi:hypothetical protein
MTTMLERYIPPAALAGFLRGLWGAALNAGLMYLTAALTTGDTSTAWIFAGIAFCTSLGARTTEGVYDARRSTASNFEPTAEEIAAAQQRIGARIGIEPVEPLMRLSREEAEIVRRLRSGDIVFDPDARPGGNV